MSAVKVAVVDSGISTHPKVGPVAAVVDLDQCRPKAQAAPSPPGHGTAVAGIIRKIAPDVLLYDIPIFDESLIADGRALTAALHWSITHRMDVVNLSLGTTDISCRDQLAELCRQACSAGLILVAAAHNEGRESYPAVFSDVIGVTTANEGGRGYYFCPGDPIECVVRGGLQRVCWTTPPYMLVSGTSFAAPYITATVARLRQQHPKAALQAMRQLLQEHSLPSQPKKNPAPRPFQTDRSLPQKETPPFPWLQKAALYPFNKEMHALVRGRDLLNFELCGIADPLGKGLVGKDAGQALGLSPMGQHIRPQLAEALEKADSLILGYVDHLSRINKKDLLRQSIKTALEHNCHIFSFHAIPPGPYADLYRLAAQKGKHLTYPSITYAQVQQAIHSAPNLNPVDVPVLGVFGTSSQQGKFTLQLALRRNLLRLGYTVGQIGTEHHAALFGMDLAFPMGYASPLNLPLQCYVPYLDAKMRQICRDKRPDIILVGSQSGTIPYDIHTHSTHSMASTAFLLGTKPDACILVVNSIDDERYIEDTLDGIHALAKAPTLALAISDKGKHIRTAYGRTFINPRPLTPQAIRDKLRQLENRFGLPAVEILAADGQQRLLDTVLRYFARQPLPSPAANGANPALCHRPAG